jgi:TonB family protein
VNATLVWNNAVTYFLQMGLLVGLAALAPPLLRLRLPGAKLAFWRLLLAACLLLPLVQPWRQHVVAASVEISTKTLAVQPVQDHTRRLPSGPELALALLGAGALARFAWLMAGFWRLQRYRRHSQPLPSPTAWSAADIRISDQIASPVTFGFRDPVILLPARFPELARALQEAILCHESLHVQRGDWLFTVGEECVRALFWFHPAIWWLLGEIQLAREQAVDREVIQITNSRDHYLDALLAIAGAAPGASVQLDLAPAPLFLRKRHLKQRVVSILKEVQISKVRTASSLAAGLAVVVAACWLVTGAFPLLAAPQMVSDAAGVSVDTGGAQLLHRSGVSYPPGAIEKGVQGVVVAQVRIDGAGNVSDASVLSGPDELRKPVLQSVLTWHFTKDAANTVRQVSVTFHAPEASPAAQASTVQASGAQRTGAILQYTPTSPSQGTPGHYTYSPARLTNESRTLRLASINVRGLSDASRDELLSRLTVHPGDTLTREGSRELSRQASAFDGHLSVSEASDANGDVNVIISAPSAAPPTPAGPIPIGGRVQASKLISQPQPAYPSTAKEARVSGTVELAVVIGTDGSVADINVVKGHPLLVQAAVDAVRQWIYEPTLLNDKPVAVSTTIDVNFTLNQ